MKVLKDLIINLLPTIFSVIALLVGSTQLNYSITESNVILSAILGFAISIWLTTWTTKETSNELISNQSEIFRKFNELNEFQLTRLKSKDEIEKQVKSLYESKDAVIYSTSINYTPKDISYSDARNSDWAKQLYLQTNCRTKFNRIVSIHDENDKNWIKTMIQKNKNPNYDIRVVNELPKTILFPNLIIVKRENNYRLFMSYRANSADGRFAFFTQNRVFCQGVWEYVNGFHSSLDKADSIVN